MKERRTSKGHDTKTLGPSDTSDSGSDVNPGEATGSDSDRAGTGERQNVENRQGRTDADRGVDRVVAANEAGLGGGLDQAEEARLGTTDEEIARKKRKAR
ncbi:MAG: hypothetical protein QOD26_738 [Betaproteobacteria bacterium]|jgi:hypothetical protein|nr:hypothetical protein [Betaproteobacteria bacterium]